MLPPYVSPRTVALGGCLALLGGVLVATASAEQPASPQRLVAAAEIGRTPLPAGDTDRSRAGLERSARRLAEALDAVPVRAGGPEAGRYCPATSLRVQWTAPTAAYAVGAHLEPVGPAPEDTTSSVNGLVVCEGVDYAYMGFEAYWGGAAWVVTAVPSLSDEHEAGAEEHAAVPTGDEHGGAHEEHAETPPVAAPPAAPRRVAAPPATPPVGTGGLPGLSASAVGGIDPYARYDPQRTCDPVAKPGTAALSQLLLRTYPSSRSLGVSRTCTARGVSEHKEGRAFDWGVNVGVAAQRAAAESALSQLLATDAAGNRHALARRLGVMYLIWDRKVWSSYNPAAGWRPYSGASPHTDHVHISLSWDGAMGRTSFWQGSNASLLRLDPDLQLAFDGASGGSAAAVTGGSGGDPSSATRQDGPAPVAKVAKSAGAPPRRRESSSGEPDAGQPLERARGAHATAVLAGDQRAVGQERREQRRARKEDKRREREARAAEAAAAQAAAEQAAAQAVAQAAAAAQAATAAAAAEQARVAQQAVQPAASRGSGKGSRKATAAAAAPPPKMPRTSRGKGGSTAKAAAPARAPAAGGKGQGKGKGGGKGSDGGGGGKGSGEGKGPGKGSAKASAPAPAASGSGKGSGKGGGKKGG